MARRRLTATVMAVMLLCAGTALGQTKPGCEQGRVKTPTKIEGQVVKVDPQRGLITVRENDGTVHEFQAGKETLQQFKPGDRIEANLREAPKC